MNNHKVLDDSKRVDNDNLKFHDDSYDDSKSSIETDPQWRWDLDSKSEPIYTLEPKNPNHVYNSTDALFTIIGCEC